MVWVLAALAPALVGALLMGFAKPQNLVDPNGNNFDE